MYYCAVYRSSFNGVGAIVSSSPIDKEGIRGWLNQRFRLAFPYYAEGYIPRIRNDQGLDTIQELLRQIYDTSRRSSIVFRPHIDIWISQTPPCASEQAYG